LKKKNRLLIWLDLKKNRESRFFKGRSEIQNGLDLAGKGLSDGGSVDVDFGDVALY
jgi:hypothetical protein